MLVAVALVLSFLFFSFSLSKRFHLHFQIRSFFLVRLRVRAMQQQRLTLSYAEPYAASSPPSFTQAGTQVMEDIEQFTQTQRPWTDAPQAGSSRARPEWADPLAAPTSRDDFLREIDTLHARISEQEDLLDCQAVDIVQLKKQCLQEVVRRNSAYKDRDKYKQMQHYWMVQHYSLERLHGDLNRARAADAQQLANAASWQSQCQAASKRVRELNSQVFRLERDGRHLEAQLKAVSRMHTRLHCLSVRSF